MSPEKTSTESILFPNTDYLKSHSVTSSRFESNSACSCCPLRKTCIVAQIDTNSHNSSLQISHRSIIVKHSEHLYFAGDKVEAIYIVKSGSFKSYVINHNGDEQVVNFHLPGDMLAISDVSDHQFESSALALETSAVCTVPAAKLEQLIETLIPDWLMAILIGKLKQQQRNISALGKKNAKRRLAAFLWDISESYRERGYSNKELKLNMSRQDIGNYLGLASETVSRIFTRMQNEGLIKLQRKDISIVNLEKLCELADKD